MPSPPFSQKPPDSNPYASGPGSRPLASTADPGIGNACVGRWRPGETLWKWFLFGKEGLFHPRSVGALMPSSRYLARAMSSYVGVCAESWVLELGAGTGSVTHALLERGVPPDRLIVVEKSGRLAHWLRREFPQVLVIQGDAADLRSLLSKCFCGSLPEFPCVVSSLPFRSLDPKVRRSVADQIQRLLRPRGTLIQFTYDLRPWAKGPLPELLRCKGRIIWRNLPPARIEIYQKP
jgi:phosphatidylethanolamine/phosphatidyl-N-methylethanolamine N-methyltransferase